MSDNKYSNYITDLGNKLFLGSWHATNPEILQHFQISSVICIGFQPDEQKCDVQYKFVTLDDNTQSSQLLLQEIIPNNLPYIHQHLQNNNVLVCCGMGKSRSVSLVSAYLIKYRNMTLENAFEYISNKRSCIHPNEGFLNALKTFQQKNTI